MRVHGLRSIPWRIAVILLFCSSGPHLRAQYEVLVNSRGTNAVFRYDTAGSFLGEFITSGSGGLSGPEDLLFLGDGSVLVTGFGNSTIKRYDGATGAYLGNFTSGYALDTPSKMSLGPDSLIYVTQWGMVQNKVVRFDLSGAFVDEFTEAGVSNGLGHFWDDEGRFYISAFGNGGDGTVMRFAPDGSSLGVFINSTYLQGPTDLWRDGSGDILVQDWTTGRVLRYDTAGVFVEYFITGLTNPEGIAFLPNGNMLMGDWGEDAVHRIGPDGAYLGHFTEGNGLTDPNGVFVRELPVSGLADRPAVTELRVQPTVGPGPFEVYVGPGGRERELIAYDPTGKVVEHRLIGGSDATIPWSPGASMATGIWSLVLLDRNVVARSSVLLVR